MLTAIQCSGLQVARELLKFNIASPMGIFNVYTWTSECSSEWHLKEHGSWELLEIFSNRLLFIKQLSSSGYSKYPTTQ